MDKDMDKFAPCPFCGGTDLGVRRGTEDREGFPTYVYCADCGAQGPWIYTRDKSVFTCTRVACRETGWNKRYTAAPELLEALQCVLENEASDHKAQEEFGGYVLDDDVRRVVITAIAKATGAAPEKEPSE